MKPQAKTLPDAPDVMAPDGSEVRILCRLSGGSMAHFTLPAGRVEGSEAPDRR